MTDDERIGHVIEALERLAVVEAERRAERDRQRADLRERISRRPKELEERLPTFDVNKVEAGLRERQEKAEQRMREGLEREQRLLAHLDRQTELLEQIVSKIEAKD